MARGKTARPEQIQVRQLKPGGILGYGTLMDVPRAFDASPRLEQLRTQTQQFRLALATWAAEPLTEHVAAQIAELKLQVAQSESEEKKLETEASFGSDCEIGVKDFADKWANNNIDEDDLRERARAIIGIALFGNELANNSTSLDPTRHLNAGKVLIAVADCPSSYRRKGFRRLTLRGVEYWEIPSNQVPATAQLLKRHPDKQVRVRRLSKGEGKPKAPQRAILQALETLWQDRIAGSNRKYGPDSAERIEFIEDFFQFCLKPFFDLTNSKIFERPGERITRARDGRPVRPRRPIEAYKPKSVVPTAVEAERNRTLNWRPTLTQRFYGDPPPWRSALFKRQRP